MYSINEFVCGIESAMNTYSCQDALIMRFVPFVAITSAVTDATISPAISTSAVASPVPAGSFPEMMESLRSFNGPTDKYVNCGVLVRTPVTVTFGAERVDSTSNVNHCGLYTDRVVVKCLKSAFKEKDSTIRNEVELTRTALAAFPWNAAAINYFVDNHVECLVLPSTGVTLASVVESREAPFNTRASLALRIIEIVSELHIAGIVHNDLSLRSWSVASDLNLASVKLTGFELAIKPASLWSIDYDVQMLKKCVWVLLTSPSTKDGSIRAIVTELMDSQRLTLDEMRLLVSQIVDRA